MRTPVTTVDALAEAKILEDEDDEEDYHRRLCAWCDECRLRQAEGQTRRPPRPTHAPRLRQYLVKRFKDESLIDRFLEAIVDKQSGGTVDVPRVVRQLKYYEPLMNAEHVERVAVALAGFGI